jgi:uncharacterized protein (TIGR02246 family)
MRTHILAAAAACFLLGGPSVALAQGAAPAAVSAQDCWLAAFADGDADAVAACYADDAVMWFPGGPMATGRQAIRDGYAHFFSEYSIQDVSTQTLGHETMGDTQAAWGTYAITTVEKASGKVHSVTGRFTDVSRKIDGRWLYVADHPSDDPPPPPAAAPAG